MIRMEPELENLLTMIDDAISKTVHAWLVGDNVDIDDFSRRGDVLASMETPISRTSKVPKLPGVSNTFQVVLTVEP